MNQKTQAVIAGCILAGTVLLLAAVIYLAFWFPHTAAVLAEQGRQLSLAERSMVSLSRLSQQPGLPLLTTLAFSFVGSLVWLIVAMQKGRKESANQPMQAPRFPLA